MKRSAITPLPYYYDRYINLVDDVDVVHALKNGLAQYLEEKPRLNPAGDTTYEEGKWTVKDILQHVIDTERVMAYRALRFARNDATPLPGFEQDPYALAAGASSRTVDSLLKEFEIVRQASVALFETFDDEALQRTGICSNIRVSVLGLGFIIAGHAIHHMHVLKEKYFPLAFQGKEIMR